MLSLFLLHLILLLLFPQSPLLIKLPLALLLSLGGFEFILFFSRLLFKKPLLSLSFLPFLLLVSLRLVLRFVQLRGGFFLLKLHEQSLLGCLRLSLGGSKQLCLLLGVLLLLFLARLLACRRRDGPRAAIGIVLSRIVLFVFFAGQVRFTVIVFIHTSRTALPFAILDLKINQKACSLNLLPVLRASGNTGVELSHHTDRGVNEVLLNEDGKSRVSLLRSDRMIGTMAQEQVDSIR
mmetsp:Transcript_26518/g.76553  ORF Transcript_26518/g.76553 Transcript_26518/m.76553 type:complete len:236 (-) Transcript_26518:1922-2629(-)